MQSVHAYSATLGGTARLQLLLLHMQGVTAERKLVGSERGSAVHCCEAAAHDNAILIVLLLLRLWLSLLLQKGLFLRTRLGCLGNGCVILHALNSLVLLLMLLLSLVLDLMLRLLRSVLALLNQQKTLLVLLLRCAWCHKPQQSTRLVTHS